MSGEASENPVVTNSFVHQYYAPPGDSVRLIKYFLTRTLPLIFLASFPGIYLVWYIPLILTAIVAVLLSGALYGAILSLALEKAGCRRKYPVMGCLMLIIAFGWWCSFVIWSDLYLNQAREVIIDVPLIPTYSFNISMTNPLQLIYLFFHPGKMIEFLDVTYNIGLYSIFSRTTTEGAYLIPWLLELAGMSLAAYVSIEDLYKIPYSSKNGSYYDKKEIVTAYLGDPKELKKSIKQGDYQTLRSAVSGVQEKSHSLLTLFQSDGETSYISIVNKKNETGKSSDKKEKPVVKLMSIDEETVHHLLTLTHDVNINLNTESNDQNSK